MEVVSNYRPRSASQSGRFESQSLGKYMQNQSNHLDEKTVNSIWKAFGSYLAKQMRNGKGISIPKFGNFTFSATQVDLSGTTNPLARDLQNRIPAFIIGKDFVSAVPLRAGVAHQGGQIRPYDIKGSSGIIPKVKINYTEVATLCQQSKDSCRNGCEQVFRFLSDKVRRGEHVSMEIPFIGQFIVRNSIAAIKFNANLQEETRGQTAKGHLNQLFSSGGINHNLQVMDQDKDKHNPSHHLGGAMRVTGDAETWLKTNLDINVPKIAEGNLNINNLPKYPQRRQSAQNRQLNRYGSMRAEDLKQKSWGINNDLDQGSLTAHNKALFDRQSQQFTQSKRPMSAVTRVSGQSHMSSVPNLGRMKLMIIANDLYRARQAIADYLTQSKHTLRDPMSSSQIQQILRKIGMNIEIGHIKSMLKELGFKWNGLACSFFDLLGSVKIFIYGQSQEELRTGHYFQGLNSPQNYESAPEIQQVHHRPMSGQQSSKNPEQVVQYVKDLFYSTGKTIFDLYNEAKIGNSIDYEGFRKIVQQSGGNVHISEADIQLCFFFCSKGKDSLSFKDFEKYFKSDLPKGGYWETMAIRTLRDWIFKQNQSSESCFEVFLKIAGRHIQKTLTLADFHKAINQSQGIQFQAVEIDALFRALDTMGDGELDIEEWRTKIYEDSLNPLQMLREIVNNNRLTTDDLLFKMHLRLWDDALDFPALCDALRKLDPSLSETQIRYLAKSLKNKDGKVEVTALLRNLCGQEHETVDFRNKVFRQIYQQIHPHKEQQLIQLLEDADSQNDGRVEPQGLKVALKKVLSGSSIDDENIERFIRFLDKDRGGKVNYMEFLGRMIEVSNRDHNPFKSVVQRLAYFLDSNKQSIRSLLKRLALKNDPRIQHEAPSDDAVDIMLFADFLRQKIDKKRDTNTLAQFARKMDIDKDGFITEIDIQTCLSNLNSEAFFKNNGEALSGSVFATEKKFYPSQSNKLPLDRALDITKQIRTSLIGQKIAYREAFNRFDLNKDGFVSFQEFSQGMDKIIQLSIPIKEKLFALMDKNEIGLVDYPNFLEVIQLSTAQRNDVGSLNDNFDWENKIIEQLKQWILSSRINVEEAFKSFDSDFDGSISKDDLQKSLIAVLKVKEEDIWATRIDRLFRLLDFYKTGAIQLSDFQRLVNNQNPYSAVGSRMTPSTGSFRKSFGGGLANTSTFDWKLSAIQQIGLIISKNYSSVKESFEAASEHLQKVTFDQFKRFLELNQAVNGFNLTQGLKQKLFSEIDPHKKGYLSENDWLNAFQSFNQNDQAFIELKNAIQVSFADTESAFIFFMTFSKTQQSPEKISQEMFNQAVNSLTSNRFKENELKSLWKYMTQGKSYIDKFQFRTHFDILRFSGKSTLVKNKGATPSSKGGNMGRTTIYTQDSSSSTWEQDIFEKVKQIIRTSSKSFEEIFKEMDTDGNGTLSQVEFRNAIRKLNIGILSREIDKIMTKIDTNQDGKIDYKEFIAKFKVSDLDDRLKERSKDKMARIKELMILHMTSPNDAFRFFDTSKLGKLSYSEFSTLIVKLYGLANEKVLAYPVIKDLFDTIDIRKDGIIDMSEWQQTFGKVSEGDQKLSMKATPLSLWEMSSREFQLIGEAIARNRKSLKENFIKLTQEKGSDQVTLEEAKKAMEVLIQQNFKKGITDDKIKIALQPAEIQGANLPEPVYSYKKLLDVYKNRHAAPQT